MAVSLENLSTIRYEVVPPADPSAGHGSVAVVTLDRPERMNALHVGVIAEMIHAVDRVRDEGTARVPGEQVEPGEPVEAPSRPDDPGFTPSRAPTA